MRILCVHQGFELYGSDRTFIQAVTWLRSEYPFSTIDVVLPQQGSIVAHLVPLASQIIFEKLFVLRKAELLKMIFSGLVRYPIRVMQAWYRAKEYDLIYINTSVVVDYIAATRFISRSSLVHIHEIPSVMTGPILRALISFSGAAVLFNSNSTRNSFALPSNKRIHVALNGVAICPPHRSAPGYNGERPLRVLMLGRLNAWKGQDLLIEAISRLSVEIQERLDVRVQGSEFSDTGLRSALESRIASLDLAKTIQLRAFDDNPLDALLWSDVLVVPSRRPESFGLVAIEAMACSRPVIAAQHGGLSEIVEDPRSGWFFRPNDSSDLARCIQYAVENPHEVRLRGKESATIYDDKFTEQAARSAFVAAIRDLIGLGP
ncbi:glycosyltransferase family 4 protein [Alsobacter sp. SYSU BS001988]